METTTELDLLVVDDDDELRDTMVRRFSRVGYRVSDADSAEAALEMVRRRSFDVAIFDMCMPGKSGLELIEDFKQIDAECEVIFLTGRGTIETAVQAMKLGAFDFLTKPFPLKELESIIRKAHATRMLRKENRQLKVLLKRTESQAEMIGESTSMQEIFRLVERAGPSDKAILVQGESGTGKELVARALHRCSLRADKPMVTINCAALPESLLESELFGHEKGAFTGAVNEKEGLFEVADGGTLFIDEVGELPGSLQAKLLRVLEDGSLRRVGSIKERRVDVRILAATNRDMEAAVAEGRFREDLYYRINVMSLELPALRDREGDIRLLVEHFLKPDWEIEPEAMECLEQCSWPGNVRQLNNAIERAKILADDWCIRVSNLPKGVANKPGPPASSDSKAESELNQDELSTLERAKIIEILRRESGNKTRAAKALGIDRRKLYRLVEKYGIDC